VSANSACVTVTTADGKSPVHVGLGPSALELGEAFSHRRIAI
jgi:hypothetical protein